MTNIQDGHLYIQSPVNTIYQHTQNPYTMHSNNSGFRTLQLPKGGRNNMSLINRSNSPFTPAPIAYGAVVMKQGYVTIPRKPRTPSWAPSVSSNMTEFQPTSPTSTMSSELIDPIYDNLGLRTTASGNSVLNLNKVGNNGINKYSMKDRPLPATPRVLYEPINEFNGPQSLPTVETSDFDASLYGSSKSRTLDKMAKIPPRPPPKPKKKNNNNSSHNGTLDESVASTNGTGGGPNYGDTSSSRLFEDEGEDGTEV